MGEKIKRKRRERNLSQTDLAKLVNTSQSMIAQLERGTKTLTVLLGQEIAKALDCTLNELING